MTKEKQRDRSLKASVFLARLLAAVPSSMYLLVIKGIYFVGSMSYPVKRMKSSSLAQIQGPVVRCYSSQGSSMTLVTLKKMKDSRGIMRWHRIFEVSILLLTSSWVDVILLRANLNLTLSLCFRRSETLCLPPHASNTVPSYSSC